jgi:hypothetical protein
MVEMTGKTEIAVCNDRSGVQQMSLGDALTPNPTKPYDSLRRNRVALRILGSCLVADHSWIVMITSCGISGFMIGSILFIVCAFFPLLDSISPSMIYPDLSLGHHLVTYYRYTLVPWDVALFSLFIPGGTGLGLVLALLLSWRSCRSSPNQRQLG